MKRPDFLNKKIVYFILSFFQIYIFRKMAVRSMRQLRVMKLYHATLVRYNDKTHRLLKACEPYVTWGEPDVRTVRDLITKRGYAVVDVSKINET